MSQNIKSRKPNFRTVSVKMQIVIGFGSILVLALLIAIIGYVNLLTLQTEAEVTFETAGRIRELSLQVENLFLSARQSENTFLNEWSTIGIELAVAEYVVANEEFIAQARTVLGDLDDIILGSDDISLQPLYEKTTSLHPLLNAYEDAFQHTVELTVERSHSQEIEKSLVDQTDELESVVHHIPIPEINQLLSDIQVNEWLYLATREQQYFNNIRLIVNQFIDIVETKSPTDLSAGGAKLNADVLVTQLNKYYETLDSLAQLERDIKISTNTFRDVTRDIDSITDQIGADGEGTLNSARERLTVISQRSSTALLVTAVIALSFGTASAIILGQRITKPLRLLSRAAEQVRQGNLEHQVKINGGSELVVLANSFNSMTTQLHQIMTQLEQRVADRTKALEASTEVSRSLSTILDPKQLVGEVVEQVRSAFDYYHAHIYLLDESSGDLVMASGTGDAGLAMLSQGHKISWGQGLVGRAMLLNDIILVSDVSKEEGWLPNPLLPDTRAEIAIPIADGDRVLGVLDIQHNVAGELTEEDARLLKSVAYQVAVGLRNSRLYFQAQQQAEREAMINEITLKIRGANSIENVLQIATEELGQALGVKRTSVELNTKTKSWIGRN